VAGRCQLSPTGINSVPGLERFFGDVVATLASCWPPQPLILDMQWVHFIRPEGIIALACACRYWHSETGERVRLCNIPSDVHQYLERMDLFRHCGKWIEQDQSLPEDARFGRSRASINLLELLPISGDEEQNALDVVTAFSRAHRIVEAWFDADEAAVKRLLTMLTEITSNVVHSQDRGFVAIQRYQSSDRNHVGSRVTIAVGDLGIGIYGSLRSKFETSPLASEIPLVTGSDYILHALQLGVTGRPTGGGIGLYQVRKLVEEWQGSLVIRSVGSMIEISEHSVRPSDGLAEVPGTQVTIRVRGSLEGV
jgi:hypothetical protein